MVCTCATQQLDKRRVPRHWGEAFWKRKQYPRDRRAATPRPRLWTWNHNNLNKYAQVIVPECPLPPYHLKHWPIAAVPAAKPFNSRKTPAPSCPFAVSFQWNRQHSFSKWSLAGRPMDRTGIGESVNYGRAFRKRCIDANSIGIYHTTSRIFVRLPARNSGSGEGRKTDRRTGICI